MSAYYEPGSHTIIAVLDNGQNMPVAGGDVQLQGFTADAVTYVTNCDRAIRVWHENGTVESICFLPR